MTAEGNCLKYKNGNYLLNEKRKTQFFHTNTEDDTKSINPDIFLCNDGKTIDLKLLDDFIFDCGPKGEDEPILMSLLKTENISSCAKPNMLPCKEGHSKCK